MSTKQRLASAIAKLPDSLSLEEAVESLYHAFKLRHVLPAADERRTQPPENRRSFEEMYTAWRTGVDPNDLITDEDDPFANVRGRSPGREIAL